MIDWPTHILPSPTINLTEDYMSNLSQTEFEISLRQRERYATQNHDKNVSWLFNRFQFDYFQSFVKHILNSGSDKFNIEIPGMDGLPITTVSLLGGVYQSQNESFYYWRVSATLRVENPEVGSEDLTRILLELTGGTPEQIMCSMESLYEYIEYHYGSSEDIPTCSLLT